MNRWKLLRYERGLELVDVARGTGLNRQTVGRLERGDVAHPSAATAKALADFYEISVAELLGVEETERAA